MKCLEIIEKEYFSIRELWGYSGISERLLRKYLTDKEHPLPHYRIGPGAHLIRVKRSDFDEWLSFQKVTSSGKINFNDQENNNK
jgi:hypothetical protein